MSTTLGSWLTGWRMGSLLPTDSPCSDPMFTFFFPLFLFNPPKQNSLQTFQGGGWTLVIKFLGMCGIKAVSQSAVWPPTVGYM